MARNEVHSIICTGKNGEIQYVAKIKHIQMQQNDEYVHFELEPWKKLDHLIRPVGYGIQTYTITTMCY